MFKRILIANRGEIACRIIKTARRMGIATVAVYSEADKDALHVEMADEAVPIGPPPAAESYLVDREDRRRLQGEPAPRRCIRATASCPSARPFPQALAKAGIVFIGPNPKAIAAMGDKIESKKAAAEAKVSTVPGHLGVIADEKQAVKIADEIGYPGDDQGVGRRRRQGHADRALARPRSPRVLRARARRRRSSFGDDRVFIEKFIVDPRHIEIQVLGDKHGNVIHLGERECSIQRRNQKVVEEAPSPLLDAATRKKMGAQAVALAKAVGYNSAGTVEFVAGQDKSFYFLEMNTRLQVEHPGDRAGHRHRSGRADDPRRRRREARAQAERREARSAGRSRPASMPRIRTATSCRRSAGWCVTARRRRRSAGGVTVRNDTGVDEGGEISLYYDPMIAKLVTHAPTRAAGDRRAGRRARRVRDRGHPPQHSVPVGADAARALAGGKALDRLHRRGISRRLSSGMCRRTRPRASLAAVAAAIDHVLGERKRRISGQRRGARGHARAPARGAARRQRDRARRRRETAKRSRCASSAQWQGPRLLISSWKPGDPVWSGTIDGRPISVQVRPVLNGFELAHRGVETAPTSTPSARPLRRG